jgi:hypothetical protein
MMAAVWTATGACLVCPVCGLPAEEVGNQVSAAVQLEGARLCVAAEAPYPYGPVWAVHRQRKS